MTGLDGGGIRKAGGGWWGVGPTESARMPLEQYAEAVAARELILDETGIRADAGAILGDVERAWGLLTEHALRYGVPMAPGDLAQTNRDAEWDEQIVNDPATQESWRKSYPPALARVSGLPMDQEAGPAAARHLQGQPSLLYNAFVPLELRRPAITGELRAHALRHPSVHPAPAPPPPGMSPAASVLPGEDLLPNLSDFARLQHALQGGDFMGTLYKEGLDPVQFARISDRWAARLANDSALCAEYAELVRKNAELAQVTHTAPLPPQDTLIFPGQRLARVSDFARVSRAAKRGEFKVALERAGIDADTFANLCSRFNERMKDDPIVAAQFKRLLDDPRID